MELESAMAVNAVHGGGSPGGGGAAAIEEMEAVVSRDTGPPWSTMMCTSSVTPRKTSSCIIVGATGRGTTGDSAAIRFICNLHCTSTTNPVMTDIKASPPEIDATMISVLFAAV